MNTLKPRTLLCRKTQAYYRVYVRENMITWQDEEDEDRIQALIKKADEDMAFILQKVVMILLDAFSTLVFMHWCTARPLSSALTCIPMQYGSKA